jgi:hypothetical protein
VFLIAAQRQAGITDLASAILTCDGDVRCCGVIRVCSRRLSSIAEAVETGRA